MRTKGFIICLLFLLLAFPTGVLFTGESAGDKSFLWEVRSETGLAYLLGSLHMGTELLFPLAPKIEEAYEKSSVLVVEVNLLLIEETEMEKLIMENAINPNFATIDQFLPETEFAMLAGKLAEHNIAIEEMAVFRPWFLATLVSTLDIIKLGFNPDFGIDLYFMQKATGEKNIWELESAAFQITMLSSLPPEVERLYLMDTLTTDVAETLPRLVEAWKRGDTGLMQDLVFAALTEEPDYYKLYEKIYFERNRQMALKIEEYLHGTETCFIVVGAGHLVGEEGIVELLRNRGYEVKQL